MHNALSPQVGLLVLVSSPSDRERERILVLNRKTGPIPRAKKLRQRHRQDDKADTNLRPTYAPRRFKAVWYKCALQLSIVD